MKALPPGHASIEPTPAAPAEELIALDAAPDLDVTARYAALRARLVRPAPFGDRERHRGWDRAWGWLGPIAVTILAGFLRFWHLDRPRAIVFDESYYVKDAASLLRFGYERWYELGPAADRLWAAGQIDGAFGSTGMPVVHPPVGKWMIAVGEQIFGVTSPWGWRFSAAACGTLAVLMVARIGRRLFGSTLLGCLAGLFLAVDGLAVVLSRTAILDGFLMFWVLAAFGCLVNDRFAARDRLARQVAGGAAAPGLGPRWWRLAAGLCLGLACGVKWSGAYYLAVFAVVTVLWDVGARRAAGTPGWWRVGLLRDGGWAFLQLVPVALVTYLAGWTGWLATSGGFARQFAAHNPSSVPGGSLVPNALRSLWAYHGYIYRYHAGFDMPHEYQSSPATWLLLLRPVSFYYRGVRDGLTGCWTGNCTQAVLALGNPALWWGGTVALLVLLATFGLRRDWRAGAILAGVAAGYLPWFAWSRTEFSYYLVVCAPFVALALAQVLGMVMGRGTVMGQPGGTPVASRGRRRLGGLFAVLVCVVAVECYIWFSPLYTAELINHFQWLERMWLHSWI